ncbi:putative bifunctional diguanylate cyclase/phosphodiesterase [Chthonobacter rhizosphaerae]|uniref:putative bifunctional diguanylate cyclase/phosphodiesterase n=1 Tax=Chthonobacter rhizosphaerae TaxID=2735553 RepID=UPI0015EF3D93|nr:bifunctional diguanylate cyclase/phosphodiesterase [Chthonobacter rhizosphaerae]
MTALSPNAGGPDGAAPNGRSAVELLSIAGLCAVLVFLEFRLGLMSAVAVFLSREIPFGSTVVVAVVGGLWAGLGVFSVGRRVELARAHAARSTLMAAFEAHRLTEPVTGLPNTYGLLAYLDGLLAEAREGAFVDLVAVEFANLPLIRDVHGTALQEAMEREIADRLTGLVRTGDFLARGPGSSFYLVRAVTGPAAFTATDEEVTAILAAFRGGLAVDGLVIPARIHVGTATARAGTIGAMALLDRADLAVHHSRRKGPGAVSAFDAEMKTAFEYRAMIETSIAGALKAGEIVPYFQPLIDLSRNKVAGFEILARWQHPTVGYIAPSVFIPIADEIGILEPLTLDLLGKACRAASAWGDHIMLAVNVSPTVLRNPAFLAGFREVLKASRFDPKRLEVEITENAFIDEVAGLDLVVASLKDEGVSISIDDFGTGYSSLQRLRSLPFDKIKIDQSFVKDMGENADSRRIVEAIIGLGLSLGLPTTAEGIEAESNRALLEGLGCSTGQGFLFAPAMPADEVPGFLTRYAAEGVVALRRTA